VSASPDNVIMTVPQIVEHFKVSTGAVRAWIAAGRLVPVRREGQGRSGTMFFARADVGALVFTLCPVCLEKFRKGTLKQKFCSRACRQKSNRMEHAGSRSLL
jgi:hypothetical protein